MWKSKRETKVLQTLPSILWTQLTGILTEEREKFGAGIQYLMVAGRLFENIWIKGYLVGWTEGYLKGADVREKYHLKAVKTMLTEMNLWVSDLYNSQDMDIDWLRAIMSEHNTSSYNEGYLDGLEDGIKIGKQINSFLINSEMPDREGVCFNKLFSVVRLGNSRAVIHLIDSASNGDDDAKTLLDELQINIT